MKIVLLVVGPLFIAVGLFWFGQGTGLFSGPHNAVLIDAGAGAVALGLVRIAVAGPQDHRRGGGYGPSPISMSASMIRRSYYFPFAFGPRRGRLKSGPFRAAIRTRNLPISRTTSCRCRRRVRDKDAPGAFLSRNSNELRRAKQLDRRSRPSWWFSLTV